jgi:hypothetical protein
MSNSEVDKKVERIKLMLTEAHMMFLELEGEKTTKLNNYPQKNIDVLINNISQDFLIPAINSIEGEF